MAPTLKLLFLFLFLHQGECQWRIRQRLRSDFLRSRLKVGGRRREDVVRARPATGSDCAAEIGQFSICAQDSQAELMENALIKEHGKYFEPITEAADCFKDDEFDCVELPFPADSGEKGNGEKSWGQFDWDRDFLGRLTCIDDVIKKVIYPKVKSCVQKRIPNWAFPSDKSFARTIETGRDGYKKIPWNPWAEATRQDWNIFKIPPQVDAWMRALLEGLEDHPLLAKLIFSLSETREMAILPSDRWLFPPETVEEVLIWTDAFRKGWWGPGSSLGGSSPPLLETLVLFLAPKFDNITKGCDEQKKKKVRECFVEAFPSQEPTPIERYLEAVQFQVGLCRTRQTCLLNMTQDCQTDFLDQNWFICRCFDQLKSEFWSELESSLADCQDEDQSEGFERVFVEEMIKKQFCNGPMEDPCVKDEQGFPLLPKELPLIIEGRKASRGRRGRGRKGKGSRSPPPGFVGGVGSVDLDIGK